MQLLFLSLIISFLGILNLLGINITLFYRQLFFLFFALLVYYLLKRFKEVIKYLVPQIFFFLLTINFFLVFFGREIKGARRWINFGIFSLQPSEFLLIFYLAFLSQIISENEVYFHSAKVFLFSLFITLLTFLSIFFQPDFTTAVNVLVIYIILLVFSSFPREFLLRLFILGIFILPILFFSLKDYQKQRIYDFLQFKTGKNTYSYNRKQAIITLGSGKFWGKGLGRATQSKLRFLPEAHTDFAFASFVEQTGFIGGAFLLILYLTLFSLLLLRLFHYFNAGLFGTYSFLFTAGFLIHLFYRTSINLGMNLNLFPIAGIPLPLFSYGGSSLLAYFIALTLLDEDKT